LPAIVLASLLLLPFLNTPFTIDDPLFLKEANHLLEDPLHPQAVDVVWTIDLEMRASNLLPGGAFAPYVLVPTALAGNREWVAHLTQLVLLAVALFGTAMVALRLGLDRREATIAALLTGSTPAVLGMAGTAMPDIPTMAWSILGMERILAWRADRKWHQGLLATFWLALAALTRAHTILLLIPAAVFLLDGIKPGEIRSSLRGPARFAPIIAVPVAYLLAVWLTADPFASTETVAVRQTFVSKISLLNNACAFLIHWVIMAPLAIPWLVIRWRHIPGWRALIALLAAAALSWKMGWAPFVGAIGALVLADIFDDAFRRRDRDQLALGVWLFAACAAIIYIQLPAKYVVPLMPSAAILLVRILPQARPEVRAWLPRFAVAGGVILSLLVLTGIRSLAQVQREAVDKLVVPRVAAGEHVWFAGHWGFHWYAEAAGAKPAVWKGQVPQRGDTVVVSMIDMPVFEGEWSSRRVVEQTTIRKGMGRVMDRAVNAGFFSDVFGFLPWVPGPGDANVFEVWTVE
jgi:hypothetical protein